MTQAAHNVYLPGYNPQQIRHHERRNIYNSAKYVLPTIDAMKEQNSKLKLLDVGTGSGTIAVSFAEYIPEGHVVATDVSDEILARARTLAEGSSAENISFQQANAYELPFADNSFDITHTNQMLLHIGSPIAALREMYRVTRPGGIVAVGDADIQTWCVWPELPGNVRFLEVLCKTHEANGGSTKGGRQLVAWALKAGVPRHKIKATFGSESVVDVEDREAWGKLLELAYVYMPYSHFTDGG